MKVIDLLNKIKNGENVPAEIVLDGEKYKWDTLDHFYKKYNGDDLLELCTVYSTDELLNKEAELIEEEKIDIENMKKYGTNQDEGIVTKSSSDSKTEEELRNYIVNNMEDIKVLVQAVKQLNKEVKELKEDKL